MDIPLQPFIRWVIGLAFALILGHFVTDLFVDLMTKRHFRRNPLDEAKYPKKDEFMAIWTGTLERFFFVLLIAFSVTATATAMVGWIAIKMTPNWAILKRGKSFAFISLLGNVVSMTFALLGGLVCSGEVWWCFTNRRLTMNPKLFQTIPIFLTLAGTFMLAFGLKIREGISTDLKQKLEAEKKELVSPTDVKQCTILINIGLLLISAAAIFQLWLLFCSP